MSILRAYLMPHPPLAVPSVGRGGEKEISKTLDAFDAAAVEIAALAPETLIFITPHNIVYSDYFHISPDEKAEGDFSRFNAPQEKFKTDYDTELAALISSLAEKIGVAAGTLGKKDLPLDHGVMVPMWFINQRYENYKTVRVSQSGFDSLEHYRLGQIIARAADESGKNIVLIAGGDLSHKMSERSSYGFAPEGPEFDRIFTKALSSGDFGALLNIPASLCEKAAECGYNSAAVLAGCFDGRGVSAKLLSYEGPFGVGYAVIEVIPGQTNGERHFFIKQSEKLLAEAREKRDAEDAYRSLARMSLEYSAATGEILPLPEGLPEEMTTNRAGVFVSLHKNGKLRGCIGTIMPTRANIAQEIINNAVSSGQHDSRFEPVKKDELAFLTYKVDVLSPPEPISGIDELDVKRYGVIVSSGGKRGLLLPNLDGIDTPEQQVDIARQKGGISEGEEIKLERFEVTRHE